MSARVVGVAATNLPLEATVHHLSSRHAPRHRPQRPHFKNEDRDHAAHPWLGWGLIPESVPGTVTLCTHVPTAREGAGQTGHHCPRQPDQHRAGGPNRDAITNCLGLERASAKARLHSRSEASPRHGEGAGSPVTGLLQNILVFLSRLKRKKTGKFRGVWSQCCFCHRRWLCLWIRKPQG